jgi:hypothetical protein
MIKEFNELCNCFPAKNKINFGPLRPGVDVTHDQNFLRFSAKTIGAFLNNQCCNQILFAKAGSSKGQKRHFSPIFSRKYFLNHNIDPPFTSGFSQHFILQISRGPCYDFENIFIAKNWPKFWRFYTQYC